MCKDKKNIYAIIFTSRMLKKKKKITTNENFSPGEVTPMK